MLKGRVIIFAAALAAFLMVSAAPCRGAQDIGKSPDELKADAIRDVNVAMRLVKQAQEMLGEKVSKESMQVAAGLYVQAGQLFEKSEMVFRALGKNYASQDDIDQCDRFKNECLQALAGLKKAAER